MTKEKEYIANDAVLLKEITEALAQKRYYNEQISKQKTDFYQQKLDKIKLSLNSLYGKPANLKDD